ncbi:MAG: FliM/FliN family flagellar motor switch protein [Marinosulfonomonas sp.]|nr:FliM/FliN family flagellar motor switch protein [Marinosulfonomonas sp.]
MNDQTEISTLRRKAGAQRVPFEGTGMTPAKAFRLALSKAAQDVLYLAMQVLSVGEERMKQAQLLETLDKDALLLLLEGPQGGKGLAVFDVQALAAVIEVQTMGHVTQTQAVARCPTRTDSAMCETVLDRALQNFEGHLADNPAACWATGFRFGARIENARLLGLALEDIEYRVFRISLDLADGAKQGTLLIALPAEGGSGAQSPDHGAKSWAQMLEKTVNASEVEISAVLHRAQVPLSVVRGFKPGDLVPVPVSAMSEVLMEGSDGRIVGRARLGKQHGFRALRMTDGAVVAPLDVVSSAGAALPDILEQPTMAPLGDIDAAPDFPMAPMDDLPTGDAIDIPMAAMPMDMEIG